MSVEVIDDRVSAIRSGESVQVVSLQGVTFRRKGHVGEHLDSVDFELEAGRVALVHTARPRIGSLFADAISGLVKPQQGTIRFLGYDWSQLDANDVNSLRSLIGRQFYDGNWLPHLSIADNVVLPYMHHTQRAKRVLLQEAARIASEFGLPGLPSGDVMHESRADLQRSACVRAFLGQPRLIVLEHPTSGLYPQLLPALINAIREALNRAAAVLWITPSTHVWGDATVPHATRYRMTGNALIMARTSSER